MMYWVKEAAINRPLKMVVRYGGGVFYNPVIRSQSFSEPVALSCELHKCFSVFFYVPLPPARADEVRQDG